MPLQTIKPWVKHKDHQSERPKCGTAQNSRSGASLALIAKGPSKCKPHKCVCMHVHMYVRMYLCMNVCRTVRSSLLCLRLIYPSIHHSIKPIHLSIYLCSFLSNSTYLSIYLIFDSCLYTAMYVYPCITMASMYHCINHWLSSTEIIGRSCMRNPPKFEKNKAPKMMIGRQSFPLKMVPFSVAMLNF